MHVHDNGNANTWRQHDSLFDLKLTLMIAVVATLPPEHCITVSCNTRMVSNKHVSEQVCQTHPARWDLSPVPAAAAA